MARTFLNKNNFNPSSIGGTSPLQFKLYGDWDKAIRVLQRIGPEVKVAGIYAQKTVANKLANLVRGHLKNQDLGWRELSSKYSKIKSKAGADSRTLIAFGNYYHAIEVWQSGSQHTIFVGVKKGKYTYSVYNGKRSKLDIARIATVHEFSTGRRVPKRPLWNPTIAEMGGVKGLQELYLKHLIGKLRSSGIPVKRFMGFKWH